MDAEPDRQVEGIDAVALHRAERAFLASLVGVARAAAILQVWVAKEAALKLTGTGLRTAPETFVVRHPDGWYVEPGVIATRRIYVHRIPAEGSVIMLAGYQPAPRLVVRRRNDPANLE